MLTQEQNDFITRVGPGAPAGQLLRRYWQPVALADELEGPRPVRPVKLMGQNFVLFRDENGELGFMDRDCAHRGADLAYGRIEDGGLRCPFHGWLFSVNGDCLETPAEPEGSKLHL
ncbi:MAG: Rieske 2Fe-2S domain-containing protein, partial [Alcaligenaceae bacterium]|nr:Rieske 2Fe-2S domain-containing protein [Alcaligenaceae bacterium]